MQQALDALKNGKRVRSGEGGTKYQPDLEDDAIASLEAELAKPEQVGKIPTLAEMKKLLNGEPIELAKPELPRAFREVLIGDNYILRFHPSDTGWMCGISNEMMDAIEEVAK